MKSATLTTTLSLNATAFAQTAQTAPGQKEFEVRCDASVNTGHGGGKSTLCPLSKAEISDVPQHVYSGPEDDTGDFTIFIREAGLCCFACNFADEPVGSEKFEGKEIRGGKLRM